MQSFIILVTLLSFSSLTTVSCNDKPVYKCTLSGTTCTFSSIRLNSTHYEWQPISDDPTVVRTLTFSSCVIPVLTRDICKTFPMITRLNMENQGVESIQEDSLFDCTRLEYIDLAGNRIEKLDKQTFYYNIAVKTLYLYNNKIKTLDEFSIFENMVNLEYLNVAINNLTEFSPELVRNNKLLTVFHVYSNDILDLEAEKIVELLPDLVTFWLDDNEISCWRLVEIVKYLTSKGIVYGSGWANKVRYYTTQYVYSGLRCNPDASWMAANYRKENSKFDERFQVMEDKLLTSVDQRDVGIQEKLSNLDTKIDKIEKMFRKLTQASKGLD